MFTLFTKATRLLVLLACLGAMALTQPGCSAPKDLVYRDFKNFSLGKLGFGSSSVKMDLVYYNPNNFGLQLKRTELDIYIDGTYLGHTSQEHQITIPRLSEFQLPIAVDVDMKNVFKNAFTTLFSKEVTVKVTGRLKLGKANVFFGMPVKYEGKHKLSPLY
jgi:LEA14-like dessication related protein